MPIYKQDEAVEGGWAQVRKAMTKFEGDVVRVEEGKWPTGGFDAETGKPFLPKEYFEITCADVKVLETSEELEMEVDGREFSFRVNCSNAKNSFWVEDFLGSADKVGLLMPDGLLGKRLVFLKYTREAGEVKFNYTNYIIDSVLGDAKSPLKADDVPAVPTQPAPPPATDGMKEALELAVGKTEDQFKTAARTNTIILSAQLLPVIQAGALQRSFVETGQLVVDEDGVYQKP